MSSQALDLEASYSISPKWVKQRAREIIGEGMLAEYSIHSLVVVPTGSQLAVLEKVVARLEAAAEFFTPQSAEVWSGDFSSTPARLAALSIQLRRPRNLRAVANSVRVPGLGDLEIAAASADFWRHSPPDLVTISWREPFWLIDLFAPLPHAGSAGSTSATAAKRNPGSTDKRASGRERPRWSPWDRPPAETLAISRESATRRAREILGAEMLDTHEIRSLVIAPTPPQLAMLEQVVNGLLDATNKLDSRSEVAFKGEFCSSAALLMHFAILLRRPKDLSRGLLGARVPGLGDTPVTATSVEWWAHPTPDTATISWRAPFWIIDIYTPVNSARDSAVATAGAISARTRREGKSKAARRLKRAQKKRARKGATQLPQPTTKKSTTRPSSEMDAILKRMKARELAAAKARGLVAEQRDRRAGKQRLISDAKIVSGGGGPGSGRRK